MSLTVNLHDIDMIDFMVIQDNVEGQPGRVPFSTVGDGQIEVMAIEIQRFHAIMSTNV